MKIRYKILVSMFAVLILLFGSGITYSIFSSESSLNVNQKLAKFIFNTEQVDHIEVPLIDVNPGSAEEYAFAISNTSDSKEKSNVTIEYEIIIKTYHLMPLTIKLYSIDNNNVETEIIDCNEVSYSPNANNEYVCNTIPKEMSHDSDVLDNYILKVTFPTTDGLDSEVYSNLVDFISLDINSWQKIK